MYRAGRDVDPSLSRLSDAAVETLLINESAELPSADTVAECLFHEITAIPPSPPQALLSISLPHRYPF